MLERSRHLIDPQETVPQAPGTVFREVDLQVTAAEEAGGSTDVSADDALRHAMLLESSELNRLDESWLHTFPPPLGALLTLPTPEDNLHLRRLVEAVHAFGTDKALHEQATSLWVKYQRTRVVTPTRAARGSRSEENGQ